MLAICGVVAVHVFGMIVSNDDMRQSTTWWVATALDIGTWWGVPVFVMISGALTLHPRAHAAGPGPFYRKRFQRILPALIFWHLVYLVVARIMLRGEEITGLLLVRMLIDAKIFTALYFLWLIAGLYLIAPVLAAFLKEGGRRRALVLAGVALSFTLVLYMVTGIARVLGFPRPISLGALTQWWPYVGYFVAGWALHRMVLSRRVTAIAAGIAAVLMAEAVWQYGASPPYPWLHALLPTSYVGTRHRGRVDLRLPRGGERRRPGDARAAHGPAAGTAVRGVVRGVPGAPADRGGAEGDRARGEGGPVRAGDPGRVHRGAGRLVRHLARRYADPVPAHSLLKACRHEPAPVPGREHRGRLVAPDPYA